MIERVIFLLLLIGSNGFTYNYLTTKHKLQLSTANNIQLIRKIDNSAKELEKANEVIKTITKVVTIYEKEKEILERETANLPTICELSPDGLRVLQDAINRSNTASNPD